MSEGPRSPWRLVPAQSEPPPVPVLDDAQRSVVERVAAGGHGPLLVLAGPGTGKTTTLVEAVAARIAAGTDPARVLTLTFSRRAAQELRARIGARVGRTVAAPLAWTFHGFGFSLLGQTQVPEDAGRSLTLLSGPEQDVAVREMLLTGQELTPHRWPGPLRAAVPTRGFTEQLRALLARARSLGMEPADLARAGVAAGRDDWVAAAEFLDEYLDVLDSRGALDYAELIARAVAWAESPHGREHLRSSYELVVVDEYQDTDPAQERLLHALAGDGRDLVVVGDPDQSIYAFRGARVDGILQFRERFRRADGAPADVAVLRECRRSGPVLLAASRSVASRLPRGGAGLVEHLRAHHELVPSEGLSAGRVDVLTFASERDEAAGVADLLRRQHLQRGRPWSDMAVLVRSGLLSVPTLQRALLAHGVPVEVAGDELPLVHAPAVRCLLDALAAVADPAWLTAESVADLLASPLVGADASQVRRLGRVLREQARLSGVPAGSVPASAELVRDAVADPRQLVAVDDEVAAGAVRLSGLLVRGRGVLDAGGSVHAVLWSLWDHSAWQTRLVAASEAGGAAGRAADRDLDALVALFDVAARDQERGQERGVRGFLAELQAQQVPGDTLAERSVRSTGVRLLTAHRSKGLEWPLVVVAGVQDEVWPDLRHRGSLLEPDRLDPSGPTAPVTAKALLDEERRLFYVATTRAKEQLVVTAVASASDDGLRPSRFLDELGVPVAQTPARPPRPLTLTGLVAELRATVVDPDVAEELRSAAAERLARLASTEHHGRSVAPSAHPDRWWGTVSRSESAMRVRPPGEPLRLSGSSLQQLVGCPLRWFLEHEVHADTPRGQAMGFGSVVHALADAVATGVVAEDLEQLMNRVDQVWRQLQFGAAWESEQQREEARAALARFLVWHQQARARTLLGSEQQFDVEVPVGSRAVLLRGRLDRVELDDSGRVVVVDFKTGRVAPTQNEVDEHLQLAVYQRAVAEGAVTEKSRVPGGAELVHLRLETRGQVKVQQQQAPGDGPTILDAALAEAVAVVDAEDFRPVPSPACSRCPYRRVCPAQDEGTEVVP